MTALAIEDVLASHVLLYPETRRLSEEDLANMITAYTLKLSDLDPQVVSVAIDSIGGDFFPSAPKIREAAARVMTGAIGAKTAQEAYAELLVVVRRVGKYSGTDDQDDAGMTARDGKPGTILDPNTQRVVSSIGWNAICNAEAQVDKNVIEKRFLDEYESTRKRATELARFDPKALELLERFGARLQLSQPGTLKQILGRDKKE